jgi:zinc protease
MWIDWVNSHKFIKIILTIILIILLPVSILILNSYKHNKLAQPTNTQVASGVIPIHFWETYNGVRVYFVPKEQGELVDIQVTFDAGSARDNGNLGLAYLVAKSIADGTNTKTKEQIAEYFDNVGALYSSHLDQDRAMFKLRLFNNRKTLKETVALFAKMLAAPVFSLPNIDRLKNRTLISLELASEDPNNILKLQFYKLLYGKHPYANSEFGDGDFDNIVLEDLIKFHKNYYVANNCVVTIVGNIHRDQARNLSNLITISLANGDKPAPLVDIETIHTNVIKKIPFSKERSSVIIGQVAATANDSDYFNFIIGNSILGNSVYSRLTKGTQEKDAIAYSINSKFITLNKPGPFFLNFYTKKAFTEKVIDNINFILTDFINNGPTDEEVRLAKQHLINSWPKQFIENENILEWISYVGFYRLSVDFIDNYIENISSVTKESIIKTWQRRINLDLMTTVIVG